jgi:SET domain-containing protein
MLSAMRNSVVKPSTVHGKGLFALRDFAAGDRVELVEGEIVLRQSESKYAIALSGRRSLLLTNKVKYVNHSSEPNVRIDPRRGLIAVRAIAAGEELLAAYASVF